jgi:hypothetical protein
MGQSTERWSAMGRWWWTRFCMKQFSIATNTVAIKVLNSNTS